MIGKTDKKTVRAQMKARLGQLDAGDLQLRSGEIAKRLIAMPEWLAADTVLGFLSMPNEVDTGPLIQAARASGKVVAVPRISGDDIDFLVLPSSPGNLPRDRWNIPEPDPNWPKLVPLRAGRILVVCPGLAFDREGNRLGRGKGFYDRFLIHLRQEARDVVVVGIGFSEQLLPSLPHEAYDQHLDALVTENETIMMGPGPTGLKPAL